MNSFYITIQENVTVNPTYKNVPSATTDKKEFSINMENM